MPKIKVNGVKLFYKIKGQGQTLVLISGFCSDHLQREIYKNNFNFFE
jgi:hypothetical protein